MNDTKTPKTTKKLIKIIMKPGNRIEDIVINDVKHYDIHHSGLWYIYKIIMKNEEICVNIPIDNIAFVEEHLKSS